MLFAFRFDNLPIVLMSLCLQRLSWMWRYLSCQCEHWPPGAAASLMWASVTDCTYRRSEHSASQITFRCGVRDPITICSRRNYTSHQHAFFLIWITCPVTDFTVKPGENRLLYTFSKRAAQLLTNTRRQDHINSAESPFTCNQSGVIFLIQIHWSPLKHFML